MIVIVDDVRKAGYCTKGLRVWLARQNIDVTTFVTHGIDSDLLDPEKDSRVARIIAIAKNREAKNGFR